MKSNGAIFNNAAQAWNHTFYWLGIGGPLNKDALKKYPELKHAINTSFGSLDQFETDFSKLASSLFGSGWIWLVRNLKTNRLEIIQTSNADSPMSVGLIPLLVCDVWEHAYYIDYRNNRTKYIDGFLNSINWDFAAQNFNQGSVRDLTVLMRAPSGP